MGNPLDAATLTVVPGFFPYGASPNFRPVSTADGSNRLVAAVARDAIAMANAFEAEMGYPLVYAEAYRPDYVQQWRVDEHARGGPLAAGVGNSTHRDATTVDYRNGIGYGPGNANYDWMAKNAARFGFTRTVASEYWHWAHLSSTTITTASSGTTVLEDDIMATKAERQALIDDLFDDPRFKVIVSQVKNSAERTATLTDPDKGVGYMVVAFVLASGQSVSQALRTVANKVAGIPMEKK